jgi:site-specific recombinase XerD
MQDILPLFRKELEQLQSFSERTIKNYLTIVTRFISFIEKEHHTDIRATKSFHLREWMARHKKRVSNSRLTHHRSALVHFFTLLQNLGLRSDNPAKALFPIRKIKSDKNQPISTKVAFKLLAVMDCDTWIGKRNYVMVSILWALGLRINELVTLKLGDFEPFHDAEHHIGLLRVHGKGNKDRALFVVDRLYRVLTKYLCHTQSPQGKKEPLFPTEKKKPVSKDRVQWAVRQAAARAGITVRVTPHILRHSFATEMYEQRIPVQDIRAMLGHRNLDETSIYVHVSRKLQKQALNKISIHGR